MTRKEVRKMKNKNTLLAVLILPMILGLSAVPVKACEGLIYEDIEHTVFDPTDDIHVTHTAL